MVENLQPTDCLSREMYTREANAWRSKEGLKLSRDLNDPET